MKKRILYSIQEMTEILGVGRSTLYNLINAGKIRTVNINRRRFGTDPELQRYVKSLDEDKANG